MKRKIFTFALGALAVIGLNSCENDKGGDGFEKRPDAEIESFSVPVPNVQSKITSETGTIELYVSADMSLEQLDGIVPNATISTGASVVPSFDEEQDFSGDVEYVVTAEDGTKKTWTVKLVVSQFVASGIGSVTKAWLQPAETMGIGLNENSIAILGDRLVVSRFLENKLFDAETGELTDDVLNCEGIDASTPIPFIVTNDDKGNLIGGILGAWANNSTWKAYKWSAIDDKPKEIIEYQETDGAGASAVGTFGRRISVVGDVDGSAIIATYKQATFEHYLWQFTDGEANAVPSKVSVPDAPYYPSTAGYHRGSLSYYQMIWPESATSAMTYYFSDPGAANANPISTVAYKGSDGIFTTIKGNVPDSDITLENELMFRDTGFGRKVLHTQRFSFNGKNYMAVSSYFNNIAAETINVYTSILEISGSQYSVVTRFTELFEGKLMSTVNGNETSGIAVSVETDEDGKKSCRLYHLFSGLGLMAYDITNSNE